MKMNPRKFSGSPMIMMAVLLAPLAICGAANAAGLVNPTVTVDEIYFYDTAGNRTTWVLIDQNYTINATVRVEDTTPTRVVTNVEVTFRDEGEFIDTVVIGTIQSGETRYATVNWTGTEPPGEHLLQVQVDSSSNDNVDNSSVMTVHRAEVDLAIMGGEPEEQTIARGASAVFRFDLANEGTLDDTYELNVSEFNPNAWDVNVLDDSNAEIDEITVGASETVEVRLRVKATQAGARDVALINLSATSSLGADITDDAVTRTRVVSGMLVVDGAEEAKDSVVNYFSDSLEAAEYTFDIQVAREDPVSAGDMANYPVILWSEPEGFLDQDEVEALTTYMGSGQATDKRSILLSGKNIAAGLEQTAWGRTFLHSKLQVDFSNGTTYATTLEGANDPIGSGLSLDISLNGAGNGARNQDYVDNVTAREADPVFLFDGADLGGTRYEGNTFNVVFLSFGFEGINDERDRDAIMKRLMLFFQGGLHGFVVTMKESKVRYIEGATVILEGTSYAQATNRDGYYFFSGIAPGDYTVTVEAEGFEEPQENEKKNIDVYRGSVTEVSDFILNIKPARFNGVL
ncbi:MAG: carboxypeptidase regulatory-like domain-containing protein, partial [Thermoplasmata archaeon]|nr:carboxypeptidase regulatory-like domain-containing protein [Thermoplasmata archaeon]